MGTTIILLTGVAVALLGVLILRMGRKLAIFLLAAGGMAVAGVVALALLGQAAASREAAKAATKAATAATVAASGQAVSSVMLAVLASAVLFVLALAGVAVGYFWLRAQRAERQVAQVVRARGKWVSGPNARWQRIPSPPTAGENVSALLPLLAGQMAAMQTMMTTWMQRQSQQTQQTWTSLPVSLPSAPIEIEEEEEEADDWLNEWGW